MTFILSPTTVAVNFSSHEVIYARSDRLCHRCCIKWKRRTSLHEKWLQVKQSWNDAYTSSDRLRYCCCTKWKRPTRRDVNDVKYSTREIIHVIINFTIFTAPSDGIPPVRRAMTSNSLLVGALSPVSHEGLHQGWTHKLHSISKWFISQVIIAKVMFFLAYLYSTGT